MKGKLTLHFFTSLCIALISTTLISMSFVSYQSYLIKKNSNAPDFGENFINQYVIDFEKFITLTPSNEISIADEGLYLLQTYDVKLQILNEKNDEIYQYNRPANLPLHYTNLDLITIYNRHETDTLFLGQSTQHDQELTYLLFFPLHTVKRYTYTYNVSDLSMTHNIPILILLNISTILFISFIYSLYLSKPLNNIISNIVSLSKGHYMPIPIKKGVYSTVNQSINDLSTKLKQNELDQKNLDILRDEWISNISHDIKTPLTSIIGSAEIMADGTYPVDEATRVNYSNIILNKSHYIKTLVDDLNLSARLKNKQIVLNQSHINLVSLIRHVVIQFLNEPKYENYSLNFNYSEESFYVDVDEVLLKRVFINLITNAIIHNDASIVINISIFKTDANHVTILIEDDGNGISPLDLEHIFNRYYRGTNTSQATEGSGLGMAIAHDIIKIHNGNINLESELNQGTQITITLPITKKL